VASKTFALNTEPHVAEVGPHRLEFRAEVMGDEFLDAYQEMREVQAASGVDLNHLEEIEPEKLREVTQGVRDFLAAFMLPDSAAQFTSVDVVKDNQVLGTYSDRDEAESVAREEGSAARVRPTLRLPDRVLIEILEWVVEVYGGKNRPPTSSTASATASPRGGRRGMGVSPSKVSTRTNGR
jgi:hypothetical protein